MPEGHYISEDIMIVHKTVVLATFLYDTILISAQNVCAARYFIAF